MCGITGIWSYQSSLEKLNDNLKRATNSIPHRGPDSDGHWFDETVGIALGHRRLAIVDISPQGHQPMLSPSQRFVIVFNEKFKEPFITTLLSKNNLYKSKDLNICD
jgi:asparagine synthase (glutamine-hydrolysing)